MSSFLEELEHHTRVIGTKRRRLAEVIVRTRASNPNHKSLPRAEEILAGFDAELIGWLCAWLPEGKAN